ncbi:MAG: NADPH:quinone oxidoreductase [Sneathiella sp.]|nr:MAG: NADPH:quinone oxidoreductase [Sneathiella sp.]
MPKVSTIAATVEKLGGPDAVLLKEQKLPSLQSGECRVRMKAAALNFPDLLMTYGKYQFRPELPFILGMEGAGIVEEISGGSHKFTVGDAVMVKGKTGAFASHFTAGEGQLERLPPSLSFEEGAAFAVTYSTAHVSLAEKAKLVPGETLLVLGAGGGVGQACVSLGKALGATVIAAASSTEKLALAKESGADYLINYRQQDYAAMVQEITNGRGADVIVDPVGGEVFERSFGCIAWGGRILIVGFASGTFGILNSNLPLEKGCTVMGVRAGEFGRQDPPAGRRSFNNLLKLTETKNLKPLIGGRWSLDQIKEALSAMERRDVSGKQIISLDD